MLKAFVQRKPWAAALVGFLIGPILGAFYLKRARLAIVLMGIALTGGAAFFAARQFDIITLPLKSCLTFFKIADHVVAAILCYYLARDYKIISPLPYYARWWGIVLIVLIPLSCVVLFRVYAYEPFSVQNTSMEPSIVSGDHFYTKKFGFAPVRGDIVVFTTTGDRWTYYVKRIIGMPGDTVGIDNGKLIINGVPVTLGDVPVDHCSDVSEKLPEGRSYPVHICNKKEEYPSQTVAVPEGNYFVLGDNRSSLYINRDLQGLWRIPVKNIVGKASFVYWHGKTEKLDYIPLNKVDSGN